MQDTRILKKGIYRLDELQEGDVIKTPSKTVSASDIDHFAELSGDFFAIHMDEDIALQAGFSGRVAHGLLILSLIDGLKNQSQAQVDAIASLGWDMHFSAPVIVGDTITATLTILDIRPTSDGSRGIATIAVEALNQHGEAVQHGTNTLMIKR